MNIKLKKVLDKDIGILITSKEEFIILTNFLDSIGLCWNTGVSYLDYSVWDKSLDVVINYNKCIRFLIFPYRGTYTFSVSYFKYITFNEFFSKIREETINDIIA